MLKLKKFLLIFCVAWLCLDSAAESLQNASTEKLNKIAAELNSQKTNSTKELATLNQNLNNELQKSTNSTASLTQQEIKSMTSYQLLDNLDLQLTALQSQVETLQALSKNSEIELKSMKEQLTNSICTVENLKAALVSNKDDTASVIEVAGELQEKVDALKTQLAVIQKRASGSYIYGNIISPLPGLTMMATGIMIYGKDENLGFNLIKYGIISTAGIEFIFQSGHFFFKIW